MTNKPKKPTLILLCAIILGLACCPANAAQKKKKKKSLPQTSKASAKTAIKPKAIVTKLPAEEVKKAAPTPRRSEDNSFFQYITKIESGAKNKVIDVFESRDAIQPLYRIDEDEVFAFKPNIVIETYDKQWVKIQGRTLKGKEKSLWINIKNVERSKKIQTGKINLPEHTPDTPLFAEAGLNWQDCELDNNGKKKSPKDNACYVDWPPRGSMLKIHDSKLIETTDPMNGRKEWQLFYKVGFDSPKKSGKSQGTGWINSKYVTTSTTPNNTPFLKNVGQNDSAPGQCATETEKPILDRVLNPNRKISEELKQQMKHETMAQIFAHVGKCMIPAPEKFPKMDKHRSSFDQTVLKYWKDRFQHTEGDPIPNVSKENLVAIDALARTLYGEVASCFEQGDQYPNAVAKITLNRVNAIDDPKRSGKQFNRGEKDPLKNRFTEIITGQSQYNTWDQTAKVGKHEVPNHNLLMTLCPPTPKSKTFWKKNERTGKAIPPDQRELRVWKKAVEIAAETVLWSEVFTIDTRELTQYYYTSGIPKEDPFMQVYPEIKGGRVSKNSCIRVWEESNENDVAVARK